MVRKSSIFKWVILLLLVGYTCWVTVWAHQEAARHVCTGIEVSVDGDSPLDGGTNRPMDSVIQQGVLQELTKYPKKITGVPLNALNTRDIEKYLGKLSNFESVNCMVTSSGKLRVRVVPLIPVMRVFFAGSSYYINKDGKHIDSNAEFYNDVPVVSGTFTRQFQPKDVLPLIRYINDDQMLSELVNMVVAHDAHNLILVPRVQGHVVNFGDTTRLDEKKQALALFYKKVMPYKGWEEYDTISVKYRGQIVATRRDKSRLNQAEIDVEEIDPEESTLPDVEAGGERAAVKHPADSTRSEKKEQPKKAPEEATKKKP